MRVRVFDEAAPVDCQSFRFEASSLHLGRFGRHIRTNPAFRCNNPMPWECSRFLFGEVAKRERDVAGNDIHVDGDAAIGREFSLGNERYEAKNFRAYTSKGCRLGH